MSRTICGFVSVKDYADSKFQDLLIKHEGDLHGIQSEVDRRIETIRREIDLRMEQILQRLDRMEEIRDEKVGNLESSLRKVEASQNRQQGRMAAYAAITGIVVLVLAIVTLILDHVRF